jgi:hypothetical protein
MDPQIVVRLLKGRAVLVLLQPCNRLTGYPDFLVWCGNYKYQLVVVLALDQLHLPSCIDSYRATICN